MEPGQDLVFQPTHGPGDEKTDCRPSDDIQGVMDSDVNAGIGHDGRNPEEKGDQPFERLR